MENTNIKQEIITEKAYLYQITNKNELKVTVGCVYSIDKDEEKTAYFAPIYPERGKKYITCARYIYEVWNHMVWSEIPDDPQAYNVLIDYYFGKIDNLQEVLISYNEKVSVLLEQLKRCGEWGEKL